MVRLFSKIGFVSVFFFFLIGSLYGQDIIINEENLLKKFRSVTDVEEQFIFFFNTTNRYEENSAYDWLDTVNTNLVNAMNGPDSINLGSLKIIQSQIYYDLGKHDKSISIANKLYKGKDSLNFETKKILLNLMDYNYAQLQLYRRQIDIRKEKIVLGITKDIVFYDIYSNMGHYNKAMKNYVMEMKKHVNENDYYSLAEYHNNVGNYLRLDKTAPVALGEYKKAKGYLEVYLNDITSEKSQRKLEKINYLLGVIKGNIGKCYVQMRRFEDAIPWLEKGIETINKYNKGRYSSDVIDTTLDLIDCHLHLEDYELAKEYLYFDLETIVKIEHKIKRNRLLASYFDRREDYKNSSFYLKKNARIQDSINSNRSEIKNQQLNALVEQELATKIKKVDEQKEKINKDKLDLQAKDEKISLAFILLTFALLGFTGVVYAYFKSIKAQRLIAEQKHIIEASLVEKDSLLKEIHHRVKNNLQMVSSLLSLQTRNTKSVAAIKALEEGKSRVKAMALIHQKLYQNDDLSVIEMQNYIESLVNSVQSVFKKGGHDINITIDAENVELDIDRAIPFGLILNELVSNSFKYAFPEEGTGGKIYIHLRKNKEEGFFEYTDNGIGMPEDSDEKVNSSMGVRLMNRLVNQLQSTLNIDKPAQGVRFWFNFK
ncbi:MAG: histidine kinase dimerization/phosphoacceptor domain -containing protein [Cellulophaga sp.]